MTVFSAFVEQYGFQPADNGYAGKYADMCLTVAEIGGQLDARLYLDLPKGARRAELLNAIREKTARYGAEMGESENPYVLRFAFSNDGTAISRMERFLNECDVLFRPYGREMGILCARCRREIKEGDSFVFRVEDGAALPVCGDCQNGNVGRAENRTTIRKKRVRRGVLGALVGMLVGMALWTALYLLNFGGFWIPAVAVGAIVAWFYRRFGGIHDRWQAVVTGVCAAFAIIFGEIAGVCLNIGFSMDGVGAEVIASILRTPAYWAGKIPSILLAVVGAILVGRR